MVSYNTSATLRENLTINQGATWSTGWAVQVGETVETLAPIDDTWTAAAQVRASQARTAALLHTFDAIVDADGNVIISVPFAASEVWSWRGGWYDVEVTNADETVRYRVVEGKVAVSNEVTVDV